jgi:hypothetical protein
MGAPTVLIIEYAARTAVLTLILCIMVKLQKLNFFFPGLLASAAIACGLDTIPYFGHYLAVPVLYLCIWKVTGASLMPDAVFTAVVSYALMFAVKVLLFTALIGDLRGGAGDREIDVIHPTVAVAQPASPVAVPSAIGVARSTNTPATVATPAAKSSKSADEMLKDVLVKGATENGDKSMLIITAVKKTYTVTMGEETPVLTTNGLCRMRLKYLNENWATVEVNGEAAFLRIR